MAACCWFLGFARTELVSQEGLSSSGAYDEAVSVSWGIALEWQTELHQREFNRLGNQFAVDGVLDIAASG